jgi:regulatory protein
MAEKSERVKAETKAFRLLGIRSHSERELRSKLIAGRFSPEVVDDVIEKCVSLGYLNDETFSRERVRYLGIAKLVGNLKIALDLKERGIASDIRREAIADIDREFDEKERIRRLLRKRQRVNNAGLADEKQKARVIRNLMSRGFPFAMIMETINEEEERVHGDDGE